ncbi:hypothetical protein TsFJ059_008256 [Trichoderma semiorbis]|uniref:2EXR domain-containing protein n=1 Tax=Trichoderma semiorbis TaxID=1491008 RepID=A0A9P8HIS3_9HYPO|nr:hypothetical protein TsFJ059_008256 [Trichoderma semiorbis]
MAAQSTEFPQFSRLPPEIRLKIWFNSLPHRVVQRDDPLSLGEIQRQQMCWSMRSSQRNASLPLIASVCRESRGVVRKWGKLVLQDYWFNLGPIWVQPRLDFYNLNCDGISCWEGDDIHIVMEFFEEGFNRLDMMPLALRAEYFFPCNLEPPPEVDEFSDYPHLEICERARPRGMPSMDDPYNEFAKFSERPYTRVSQSATLAFICIHATQAQAADSGLFGLLLDTPVQLVDCDDDKRLRAFHGLFQNGSRSNNKRLHVRKQFDSVLAPDFKCRVQNWREKVDWLMMTYAWLRAKYRNKHFIPIDGDPGLAWSPPLLDNHAILYMNNKEEPKKTNVFNDRHPWVIQAKKELPRITPKIQFILCTDECDIDDDIHMERDMGIPRGGHSPWFRTTLTYADLPELS